MKLEPLGQNIIAKKAASKVEEFKEVTTEGGEAKRIFIPDAAQTPTEEKNEESEVLAVGPGRTDEMGRLVPMQVKVGDKVLHSKFAYTEFTVDGEKVIILTQDDVLAIVRP